MRNVAQTLRRILEEVFTSAGRADVTADVVLLDDERMEDIRHRFFHDHTAREVFSFPETTPFPHPETDKRYLGEVYLNNNLVAGDRGRLVFLLTHGALHLLGYNHSDDASAEEMERLEGQIMEQLQRRGTSENF